MHLQYYFVENGSCYYSFNTRVGNSPHTVHTLTVLLEKCTFIIIVLQGFTLLENLDHVAYLK